MPSALRGECRSCVTWIFRTLFRLGADLFLQYLSILSPSDHLGVQVSCNLDFQSRKSFDSSELQYSSPTGSLADTTPECLLRGVGQVRLDFQS